MRRPAYVKQRRRKDRKITFLRAGGARNEMNEPSTEFAPLFTTRCAAYPSPGFERIENSQQVAVLPILIEVRSETRTKGIQVTDKAAIGDDPTRYDIVSIEQPDRGGDIRIVAAAMI